MSTTPELPPAPDGTPEEIAFREGLLVGLLVGEGHFGGDGKQPQITLRMHTRHAQLFDWIEANFPGGKRFGPYSHGGRHYFQWMARGRYLRERLLPILTRRLTPDVDTKGAQCYQDMVAKYHLSPLVEQMEQARLLRRAAAPPGSSTPPAATLGAASLDTHDV